MNKKRRLVEISRIFKYAMIEVDYYKLKNSNKFRE